MTEDNKEYEKLDLDSFSTTREPSTGETLFGPTYPMQTIRAAVGAMMRGGMPDKHCSRLLISIWHEERALAEQQGYLVQGDVQQ